MRNTMTIFAVGIFSIAVAACGSGGGAEGGSPPGSGGGTGSAGGGGSGSGTGSGTGNQPAATIDYAAVCGKMATAVASCAGGFDAKCQQVLKTAAARGCDPWLPQLQTWVLGDAQPYACTSLPGLGAVPTLSLSAPEEAVVADACSAAVNNSSCYGISCQSYTDCQSGWSCNKTTGHCYDNAARQCGGLPCVSYTDCPGGHTCNTAVGICIKG